MLNSSTRSTRRQYRNRTSARSRRRQYEIESLIGYGGMGEVLLATDHRLDRQVALKTLPPDDHGRTDLHQRLLREAKTLARLDHPGIVRVLDLFQDDSSNSSYLVMEYVPGRDLTEFIARGPFAPDLYRDLALQICDAVSATHAAGFVHRDLKPANIRVRNDLCIKVLDFGLARSTRKNKNISSTSLTIPGQIMGSPLYLSPEQSRGEPLDERSDVFALGIILFEMATGGKPFTGKSLAEYCSALEVDQPPRVRDFRRDLPRGLDRVIYGCLRKRRALRFSSGKQVRDALRGCFEESTTRVRSKHILIAGGTGLLLGCMAMLRRQRS